MNPASARNALLSLIVLALLCEWSNAQAPPQDLTKLRLEDLMNIEVTSVSKKEQKMSRTAAAVFVITADDIARSGATNIPDLLRMAPGVEVAQISSNTWAISIRGFNSPGQYSNKLLVLVDGRTVYSTIMSGVFWNAQDIALDNIDRIEVIRGPGGTVWGANAVNGVINIITKKAGETQGGLVTAGAGTYELGFGNIRYGGRIGSKAAYRIFGDGFGRNHFPGLAGGNGNDDWRMVHTGFRADIDASPQDSVVIEGDGHRGRSGEITSEIVTISPPVNGLFNLTDRYSGWDVLSRWNHAFRHSETSLLVYFDRMTRDDTTTKLGVNTFNIDFQDHMSWGSRQDIVWGLGYRVSADSNPATPRISFIPARRTNHLFSCFVQDEIAIRPNRLFVSSGIRFEQDRNSGFGLEPNARIAWIPNDRNTIWAAVSQAQRTPSRVDTSLYANMAVVPGPTGLPIVVGYAGNPNEKAERETSFEAGYRAKLSKRLSVDSTAFFNQYRDLMSIEPGVPQFETNPSPYLLDLSTFANLSYGETHGFEAFADWKVTRAWTLSPGYSFLTAHIHQDAASLAAVDVAGGMVNHQAQLRSEVNLPAHWQWNTAAYFVGGLPVLQVPSYTRLDSNLIWVAGERFSISLVGQNLLRDRHLEDAGAGTIARPDMVKRSAYVKFSWSF